MRAGNVDTSAGAVAEGPGADGVRRTGRLCSVCGAVAEMFGPGPGGKRQDAACRQCGSLERHRFLALVADGLVGATAGAGIVLDVAPMRQMARLLKEAAGPAYVSIDFDPAADRRVVDVAASLTHVPLRDASVAVLVCMHVLEHIPDDRAAMREIRRCLSPAGMAVVQVPRRPGATDEDPSASPEERLRRFGQADHVRYYGDDLEDRMREAGLAVTVVTPGEFFDGELTGLLGLIPDEPFWLCTTADGARSGDAASWLREHLLAGLGAVLRRSTDRALAEERRMGPVGSGRAPGVPAGKAVPLIPRRVAHRAVRAMRRLRARVSSS